MCEGKTAKTLPDHHIDKGTFLLGGKLLSHLTHLTPCDMGVVNVAGESNPIDIVGLGEFL